MIIQFSVETYREPDWGTRRLGKNRYALDLGKLCFKFEIYSKH